MENVQYLKMDTSRFAASADLVISSSDFFFQNLDLMWCNVLKGMDVSAPALESFQ